MKTLPLRTVANVIVRKIETAIPTDFAVLDRSLVTQWGWVRMVGGDKGRLNYTQFQRPVPEKWLGKSVQRERYD